jgi:hypothetical protein
MAGHEARFVGSSSVFVHDHSRGRVLEYLYLGVIAKLGDITLWWRTEKLFIIAAEI